MEVDILDIKRENYKLRKENFELIQDNAKLNQEKDQLLYKLKEKLLVDIKKAREQTKQEYISKISKKIEHIINTTNPTPMYKPKKLWSIEDYERLYKTMPLYELLESEERK